MLERFEGSLLGVALGDALGAPQEGGILEGAVWKALGVGKGDLLRWTDDTQMTIGLAESLVDRGGVDPEHLATRWARSMEWSRGYGPGASRLLRRIRAGQDWREANRSIFPDGSYGNGGAMRAAPIGLWFHGDPDGLEEAVRLTTSITHAHPLGIEGAMAGGIFGAYQGKGALPGDLLDRLEMRDRIEGLAGAISARRPGGPEGGGGSA